MEYIRNIKLSINFYIILFTTVAISSAIYALRVDHVVGMFRDDAWYALLGKALATGHGYSMINSPSAGIVPIYPPFFPFLLSIVFRIFPDFPDNLLFLKLVSITAMFLSSFIAFCYYRQRDISNPVSIFLAQLVLVSPGLVFIATSSLMSECVFTLVYIGSIFIIEKAVITTNNKHQLILTLLGSILVSATVLTRSIAITLFISVCLYLVLKRNNTLLILFIASTMMIVGSWNFYSRQHTPTLSQKAEANSYILTPYTEQFWDKIAGVSSEGKISLAELPVRIGLNIISAITLDIGGIVVPSFYPALNQGLAERFKLFQSLVSIAVFILIVVGYYDSIKANITVSEIFIPLYVLIVLAWPFPPYRFLLPLYPILLLYLITGWKRIVMLHLKLSAMNNDQHKLVTSQKGITGLAIILLFLSLYSNIVYINRKYSISEKERPKWIRIFDETSLTLNWVNKNIQKDSRIATENPALLYLFTGNKTVTYDNPGKQWNLWKNLDIRYYVSILAAQNPSTSSALSQYNTIYFNTGNLKLRVIDFGPPESRKPLM